MWHPAGPTLPASYARLHVTVLRLTATAGTTMALLTAGTGAAAHLLAAWSTGSAAHWALSQAAATARRENHLGIVRARRHRGGGADREPRADHHRPGGHLAAAARTAARNRDARTGSTGAWDALAVDRTRLTVWQLPPGGAAWAATRTISVPIEFGSSG